MLNATDVWEKGWGMLKVGVAPQLLNEGAVAFELATDKTMRERCQCEACQGPKQHTG